MAEIRIRLLKGIAVFGGILLSGWGVFLLVWAGGRFGGAW